MVAVRAGMRVPSTRDSTHQEATMTSDPSSTTARATRPFAVVTGASSGIGPHLAKELAKRGYDLLVSAENTAIRDAGDALSAGEVEVEVVQSDLSTSEGVEALVSAVRGRPVDVLCLNAGVANAGPFVETSLEDDLALIGLNVTAPVHLAKRLLPAMVTRREGRVLVTASVAGVMPGPWYATYAASKSFILSWAEAVRHELRDTGVTITALMPGPTDTNFFDRAGMEDTEVADMKKDQPEDVARDGIDAMLDGKDHIVAHSWRNKVQVALGKGMPEPAKALMHAAMSREKD
jgi:short-subunit dehydrogenase